MSEHALVFEEFDLFKFLKEKTNADFAICVFIYESEYRQLSVRKLVYSKKLTVDDVKTITGDNHIEKKDIAILRYSELANNNLDISDIFDYRDVYRYDYFIVDFERHKEDNNGNS